MHPCCMCTYIAPSSRCRPGCGGPTPHHLCGSTGTCSSSDCHQTLKLIQYTSVQQPYILLAVPPDTSVPGRQNVSTNSNYEAHSITCSTSTCTHNHNTTNKERQYIPRTKEIVNHLCIHPNILYMMIKYMRISESHGKFNREQSLVRDHVH